MNPFSIRYTCLVLALSLFSFLHPGSKAEAASAKEIDADANAALSEFIEVYPAGKELVTKASGTLIFPSVVKAGLVFGGEYGEGVLRIGGYTAGYYSTATGSVGLQAGLQTKNVIILFMNKDVLDSFRDSNGWEAGVDGSVAVVTLGAAGSVDTNTLQLPIIGFVFGQKGLMGNLTLEGTKMTRIDR